MDIEGLGKLMESNHSDALRQFADIRKRLDDCSVHCNVRMEDLSRDNDELDNIVKEHAKTIIQIKTIGSLLSLVWGAIVIFLSNFVGTLGK